jgi:hypothetical protein
VPVRNESASKVIGVGLLGQHNNEATLLRAATLLTGVKDLLASQVLTDDGLIVGISYAPSLHGQEPA